MPPKEAEATGEGPSSSSTKLYLDVSGRGGFAPRWYGDEGDTTAQKPNYRYINTSLQDATGYFALSTYFGPNIAMDGQVASGFYNPFRRYGYMCPPNNTFTTITQTNGASAVFTNEVRSSVYDPGGYAYFAENGGLIWRANPNNQSDTASLSTLNWTLPGGNSPIFTFPIQVSSHTINITDLHIYQVNGAKSAFFTFIDSNNNRGDIGYFSTPTESTFNSPSYGKAVAAWINPQTGGSITSQYLTNNDHFMYTAADNYAYIGDGNLLHRLDGTTLTGGTTGTIYNSVLAFPANYTLRDGLDWKGVTFLAYSTAPTATPAGSSITYGGNECGVATWSKQLTDQAAIVPIKGIIDIRKVYISQKGTVRIICLSAKNTTQIREYDGTKFNVLVEMSADAYPTYRDSATTSATLIYWMGRDLKLYAHGSIQEGDFEALYRPGDASGTFGTINASTYVSGAVLYLDNNGATAPTPGTPVIRSSLVISAYNANASTTGIHKAWYPNFTGNDISHGIASQTIGAGNVYTLVEYFQTLVRINYIRVYHHNASALQNETNATRGTILTYLNESTTAANTTVLLGNDLFVGYKYIQIGQATKSGVYSIQFQLQFPSGNAASDTLDWMPRMIEIDYSPLTKRF